MTTKELIKNLSHKIFEIEKEDLEYIVEQFFEIIKDELKKGNRIELRDFGVFSLKKTKEIIFKNPKNKQSYYIKEKFRVLFKPGKEFKERLNSPFLASLDLGTQTFRLCMGKVYNGKVYFLNRIRENVRLGQGLSGGKIISSEAFQRGIQTLKKFKEILQKYEIKKYKAIGTEVLRKAKNASTFLEEVRNKIGIEIEVISPEKEGFLSLKGVLFGLEEIGIKPKNLIIIDVGGGSSEFVYLNDGKIKECKSIELGAVTLKEMFDLRYPMTSRLISSLKDFIKKKLSELPVTSVDEIVITGGTASLLGCLHLKLTQYVPERLHGCRIFKDAVEKLIKKLAYFDLERLQKVKGMEKGREDICIPGLLIYSVILDHFGKDNMILSEYGVLEGTLLSLIEDYNLLTISTYQ